MYHRVTWSTKNVTNECQGGRGSHGPGSNSPGNGHGIQLSTGELVIPMYGGDVGSYGASLSVSRSHGQHWNATPFSVNVGDVTSARDCCDEIEVAELPGTSAAPVIYMTIRNDFCPNGVECPGLQSARQFSVSQ